MTRTSTWRWLGGSVALISLLVGLVGFAHTRAGRPLLHALARVAHGGGCPLGYDRAASPAERERARGRFARTHRGSAPAAERPALGFALDRTTRAEVLSFMAAHGVACREKTGFSDLACDQVPTRLLPAESGGAPRRDLWFNFGEGQRLIALTAISRADRAESISAAFDEVTEAVGRASGPATTRTGDATALALSSGSLRQASAEFRFSDYYALARATNLGHGFLLTEEYRSLPN